MDPHLGGRVQAMIPGRIEAAGAHGLPSAGSKVRKGDTGLGGAVHRADRAFQSGCLAGRIEGQPGAGREARRIVNELATPFRSKEIEIAESDVASLRGRIAAVGGGLSSREALLAPVSGVIAASNAVVGQVVEPRELIFEIIDPDGLHVEASAYETLALEEVAAATVAVGERSVPLNFVGASRRLREQALPLIFENHAVGAGLTLPLGQPVKVQVQHEVGCARLAAADGGAQSQYGE
jgi:cobalt-zinc-cadmium efflux system membrane fusion protein